jgi:uncharacterized protein
MRTLSADDIEALATGAWILGTGGGGSPYHALLELRRLMGGGAAIRLMDPQALADDDHVAVVSIQGAPLVIQERLVDSRMIARSVQVMEAHLGRPFRAVMPVEIGGMNGLQPLLAAAHLGIPAVDADAMGRAFPEAQMTTFAVGALPAAPLNTVDPRGNEAVVTRVADWPWMERLSRRICTEFGSIAATCKAPRTGAEVKRWAIRGTTSRAIALGHAVHAAQAAHADPIEAVLAAERGQRLFAGKIVGVERRTTAGFLRGRAEVESLGEDRGARLSFSFQNEWIVAWQDGTARAMTPELICVLDSDSGEAIGTETVRYGQCVTVIVLPAAEIFLIEHGLTHVGPRAFGHDLDFRSVFAA